MKNKWKILCGIFTMSTMLVSAGCGNSLTEAIKESKEAYAEIKEEATESMQTETTPAVTAEEDESANDIMFLSGEVLDFGDDSEDGEVVIQPTDLKILDELPDILSNSDLPKMDHYSKDTNVAVNYYNPAIPGYVSIVSYNNGEAEIFYNCENNGMNFYFYRPSGTYFGYSVRGYDNEHISSPVFGGYDIPMDGVDFAEFSKDIYANTNGGSYSYYSEDEYPETLDTYKESLNTIFARFGVLSNEAFDELGLTWEDFGINFGNEYAKYDALATLVGNDEKVPMLMEKQTFTNGKNDATGQTWIETVRDGIMKQATYNSREGAEPSGWFAYNEADSNNFVDGSDYVQIETYDDEVSFMTYYHSGGYEDEDRYASRVFTLIFIGDEDGMVDIEYRYDTDFRGTDSPGVITSDTRMGFMIDCAADEVKDIFASEESLKAALVYPNYLYEESEYMSNDEMIKDFMTHYKRYMGSIDDNIKTMGTCLADYGIEY